MKRLLCWFGCHEWVVTNHCLAETDTRQCEICHKKQYWSGDWMNGKWR